MRGLAMMDWGGRWSWNMGKTCSVVENMAHFNLEFPAKRFCLASSPGSLSPFLTFSHVRNLCANNYASEKVRKGEGEPGDEARFCLSY